MQRSIDTIAAQCEEFGYVNLTREEIKIYVPNLDVESIRGRRRIHLSAPFTVAQDGYLIKGRVTYLPNTHQVNQLIIHNMVKEDRHQEAGTPYQHRRKSA